MFTKYNQEWCAASVVTNKGRSVLLGAEDFFYKGCGIINQNNMHSFINSYKNSSAESLFFFFSVDLMLQRLPYLFTHGSSLLIFTSPRSHSHSWFQCFVIKFTDLLIKKPIILLWAWEGWWFSSWNYSVMHLFTSRRQAVLNEGATCWLQWP